MTNNNLKFLIPTGKRIWLFLLVTLLCMVVGSVLVSIISMNGITPTKIRIATVMQDLTMFILPAIIVAIICTRTPAKLLMIDRKPDFTTTILVIGTLVAAIPFMNWIIAWNNCFTLPESLSNVEQWMRLAENNASQMTLMLFGDWSIAAYILSLSIVAILAGLSEELYFRGTLQRLIATSGVNKHSAIWITAIIFSAVHMQFFGFVPRMLLGAYFGYLAVWTKSLWIPIIAHTLNNALAATALWQSHRNGYEIINNIGTTHNQLWITALSLIVTTTLIYMTYKNNKALKE
ncbi:MAG: CPBP family intramembrane metalloprotease [Paramuribaculum sp.]|nr:CPBP family intramembrane metalloprotease [Paramuribaculum sp.]